MQQAGTVPSETTVLSPLGKCAAGFLIPHLGPMLVIKIVNVNLLLGKSSSISQLLGLAVFSPENTEASGSGMLLLCRFSTCESSF